MTTTTVQKVNRPRSSSFAKIRRDNANGVGLRKLAERYNCSVWQIRRIVGN